MTTIMRDSTNPNGIPLDTPIVGGYVDGLYVWSAAGWARFPNAQKRRIAAVTLDTPSNTADVERYDLSPAQAPIWWHNMTALGETNLWVYCSRSPQKAVEDALWAGGVPLDGCSMWIATLDGTQNVARYRYPIAAVQYIDTGPYDESVVFQVFGPGSGGDDMFEDPDRAKLTGVYDSTGNGQGSTLFGVLKDQIVATIGDGQGKQIMPELAATYSLLTKVSEQLDEALVLLRGPAPQAPSSPVGQDQLPGGPPHV